jgi:hypothetical protein
MTFEQYKTIEDAAGGVGCSNRQFIKAARVLLSTEGRKRWLRDARHEWLRDGLEMKEKSSHLEMLALVGWEEEHNG